MCSAVRIIPGIRIRVVLRSVSCFCRMKVPLRPAMLRSSQSSSPPLRSEKRIHPQKVMRHAISERGTADWPGELLRVIKC